MIGWIGRHRLLFSRIVAIGCVPIILFSHHRWDEEAPIDMVLDTLGYLLIAAGVLGRIWAMLYIGGRKNHQLVTIGPYALCRNPLYLFTLMLAAGVLCVFENLLLVLPVAALMVITYPASILREERYLRDRFGEEFRGYAAAVPRLLPGPHSLRQAMASSGPLSFDARFVLRGMWETGLLLLFVPLAEVVEHLHVAGVLPVLLRV